MWFGFYWAPNGGRDIWNNHDAAEIPGWTLSDDTRNWVIPVKKK